MGLVLPLLGHWPSSPLLGTWNLPSIRVFSFLLGSAISTSRHFPQSPRKMSGPNQRVRQDQEATGAPFYPSNLPPCLPLSSVPCRVRQGAVRGVWHNHGGDLNPCSNYFILRWKEGKKDLEMGKWPFLVISTLPVHKGTVYLWGRKVASCCFKTWFSLAREVWLHIWA